MSTPILIVISAPSGCGKTTIAKDILKLNPELTFSVSATTRKKRNGEIHGKDYYFVTLEDFLNKIKQGELIEWEQIYTDYYGSLHSEIERAKREGKSLLFDIDVKGALSIKQKYPNNSVLIFIKPPSIEILIERLKNRKTEDAETLQRRLERVPMELQKAEEFDYQVVNDDLATAISEVDKIVKKHLNLQKT